MSNLSVEERLQRLEDIEEIRKLKARYAEACDDDHNGDRVAALFMPDGVWHQTTLPPCNGHEEIKAFMYSVRNSGRLRRSSHQFTNPIIDVEGDKATGRWKFVMMYTGNVPEDARDMTDGGDTQFHRIIGRYDEEYERHNGEWFFRRLLVTVEENQAYSHEPSVYGDGGGSIAD